MDYYSDLEPTTTEQLTVAQINQLKDAWQRANDELVKYKTIAQNLQQKVENLTATINESCIQLELEAAKSQLSQTCCSNPNEPVFLVKELVSLLPRMHYHSLAATAFVKTGESWIALSSSTVTQETIHFKSRIFEEMLRFRSRSKTSRVTVESLPNILPLPVINYIHSGTVPATESAFDTFTDDSKGHGQYARRSDRAASSAETLYHEAIIVRLSGPEDHSGDGGDGGDGITSERCVWVITVAPQHAAKAGVDIYSDEIPVRRVAVEHFGAHPLILSGAGDYNFATQEINLSELAPAAVDFWFPLLDCGAQLVMTALLHRLEAKQMRAKVLRSDAVSHFSSLLSNANAASADLLLEEAGLASHPATAQLLETMSQRSEEDNLLQANALLDDAYWDRVWQLVPTSLEQFLVDHLEGLAEQFNSEELSGRVQRTCRCEVYIGSSAVIAETNKRATSHQAGSVTEIPVLNSKRAITMLRLQERDSIDGHIDAQEVVLRSALLRDAPAVQSYSEVSFHEKSQANAGGPKGGKFPPAGSQTGGGRGSSYVERGPYVEFHTVIAVPLLREGQQEALYQNLTAAEEGERGLVKGCVLVHVVSVLTDSAAAADAAGGYAGLASRAHPIYAASFSASSATTHSAYMEQLAGSYNLLESGRQALVVGVVDVVGAVGNLMLSFLYAHNCRPMSLLPMSAPPTNVAITARSLESGKVEAEGSAGLGLGMGSTTTSYADAARWNQCITDGLFSLLLPSTPGGPSQGQGPSLASLAHSEEAKVGTNRVGFQPLSRDRLLQHNARDASSHAALVYHLCTLFHSDWVMIFTSESASGAGGTFASAHASAGERTTHWAPHLSTTVDDDVSVLRVIDNAGVARSLPSQELPVGVRSIITQALHPTGAVDARVRAGHSQGRLPRRQGGAQTEGDFIREVSGVKSISVAELLPLLHVDARMKQNIHQIGDSDAATLLHHAVALSLHPHTVLGNSGAVPSSSNIFILIGRFFRGPFYTPFYSTPSVVQLNVLFQTAIARRDLLFARDTVGRLIEEKNQTAQEMTFTRSLEERLGALHKSTLSGEQSNIASLVAFRKGLLGVLIDFFSEMHRLHFASYTVGGDAAPAAKGMALEVIGIELVVDESTGLEEGRKRKWALSSSTADWVRVLEEEETIGGPSARGVAGSSSFQRTSRRRVIQAVPQQQTLHSQLNVAEFSSVPASLTAEVVVDELNGVYEEHGASVLHIHRKQRHHAHDELSEFGDDSDGEETAPQDLIGMVASIHVHYELPVTSTGSGRASTRRGTPAHSFGSFFASLQSSPVWMRILRSFIGANAQALFQPLYPIYTPLKLQNSPYQQVSIDEEQQWEDDALYAQASSLAISALSTTIVHDSTRMVNKLESASALEAAQQHPHYRYLHQRKLLRQLTVVPPFSAFMLIPIRELTTTEVSGFDEESDSDSTASTAEVDVEDVRYVHLLPATTPQAVAVHGQTGHERRKASNAVAQSMLPLRLNQSIRDAVRSAREERLRTEETLSAADAASARGQSRRTESGAPGSHRLRTSRLTVLDGGMGGVLHNYLSDLHERQQRRRAHNTHRGNHEYDLYGYVDTGGSSGGEKPSSRSHAQEIALVDQHSLVLLYTPLLHTARKVRHGLDALDDEGESGDAHQGLLTAGTTASLDHYYLVVCRQDRMIVPSSLLRLQTCLDELFLPSRVLAASQPWFECMSGIEQIVKAATMETSAEFKSDALDDTFALTQQPRAVVSCTRPSDPHTPSRHLDLPTELKFSYSASVLSVEGQCQRILMETISVMKRIVGDRCLGAVGYQLRVNQADLPDLIAATNDGARGPPTFSHAVSSDSYRKGREIELVRCCSDVGLVSSPSGRVMSMLQGPARLQCPATASHILERFSTSDLRTHKSGGHSPLRQGHHHAAQRGATHRVAIHYVEMSSLEHIKQLQHSAAAGNILNTSAAPRQDPVEGSASPARVRRTNNVAAVQEVLSAAHVFLRADLRVLQLLITSCPTAGPDAAESVEPHVVASVLLYLAQPTESVGPSGTDAGEDRPAEALPTVAYIHRDDVLHQVESLAQVSLHRSKAGSQHRLRAPHVSTLSRGILSCLMRVGDTTGSLVSSLYRQQYDSYLQAHTTRHHRAQMQLHAHKLTNTLLQIDHDLSAILPREQHEHHHEGSAQKAKKGAQPRVFHFGEGEGADHSALLDDPNVVMAQFVTEAERQKEAAEQALDSAHLAVQQFYAFQQQYAQEQQASTEVRSKYAASVEECRRKATQFRKFYEAVRVALAVVPLPGRGEDDADSLNSGLDKVAVHNAAVPDLASLQKIVAGAACTTQTLRKALELLAELAVHEEFSQFFNTLLANVSDCSDEDGGTIGQSELLSSDDAEGGDYDRILQLVELTPYARSRRLAIVGFDQDAPAPSISASVWWILEPGSHVAALDLASAVQAAQQGGGSHLDANALHSKEKFLDALNTKQTVLVEGEELLRMLPHLMAHFSAHGHGGGAGPLPEVRLLYQPVLATLPREEDAADELSYSSAEESHTDITQGEAVVVAIVQYVMAGGSAGNLDEQSTIGGSAILGSAGNPDGVDDSLEGVMRQVGRESVEQAIRYMGQHATLRSKITSGSASAVSTALNQQMNRSSRYSQHTLSNALHQFVPRLLQENNLVSGVHYNALLTALRYIMDPVAHAPPSAAAPALTSSAKKDDQSSKSTRRTQSSANSLSGKRSGGSVKNLSISSRSSEHTRTHNAEKVAAAAVYNPISVWIGKLLATTMRADAACMLHISGSVKPAAATKTRQPSSVGSGSASDYEGTSGVGSDSQQQRHSNVVYEGVLYKYDHGIVIGGAANDDRSSLNILHVRPSAWAPLQTLIDRYHAFCKTNGPETVFVTYQESVLSYTRKVSSSATAYSSSRSVATHSNVSSTGTEKGSGAMRYILACSINTSAVAAGSVAGGIAGSGALSRRNVHFVDSSDDTTARTPLKENDDFIVVELSRRPTSADLKAFAAVSQLVQTFIWGQSQRNCIKQKDTELGSISGALAATSQRLVEEQRENQLHHQYADLMQELHRQMTRSQSERSAASVSSAGSGSDAYLPPGGEFTPRVTDILQCVQRTQDLLCEVFGGADSATLLAAPRMVCNEVRDLLRADTMSVASRGSSGVDDELLGNRVDTVSRNISRALARIMAVEYVPGHNGLVNVSDFQEAAAAKYEVARRKFAALAVQLNQVLVCDVADVIADEALSLNINISRAAVPEIARSVMIPIIEHAHMPGVMTVLSGVADGILREEEYPEGQPTDQLSWLDHALKQTIGETLGHIDRRVKSPDFHAQAAYFLQHYYDQRPRAPMAHAAVATTVLNSSHAWALQLVFPTMEARDQFVTTLLGGGTQQPSEPSPAVSPYASPVKGGAMKDADPPSSQSTKCSDLPVTFVAGVSQFLKTSFVHCRNYVKDDVSLLQARFEQGLSDRVSSCMDQVLLLTNGPTATDQANTDGDEDSPPADNKVDFSVDAIAAAVAHVFAQLGGKTTIRQDGAVSDVDEELSDEDEEAVEPAAPTAATFECTLGEAQLHWLNQASQAKNHKPGPGTVRFSDQHYHGDGGPDSLPLGAWFTVSLEELEQRKSRHSAEEKEAQHDAKASTVPSQRGAPSQQSSKQAPQAAGAGRAQSKPHLDIVTDDETGAAPEGYKIQRDSNLHKRCRDHAWRTQKSTLTVQQIQALKDSTDGLLLIALPATTPLVPKAKRARSSSPTDRRGQFGHGAATGGSAGYTSTSKHRTYGYYGSGGSLSGREDDQQEKVGAYLNADGSVHLQMLVLVPGSEQPAILELRLKCHVTSGVCSPDYLARQLHRRRSRRKAQQVQPDELALAEMLEQVSLQVLQPTLPTLRLVRSSVAHLLEHCVAARGLVAWEADWEEYLQHAQQRISLLSTCMALLTSEGYKAAGLLQVIQEALCRLPSLCASTLIARDTITNQIIYNRTMDYSTNTASDFNEPPTPAGESSVPSMTPLASATSARSGFMSPAGGGGAFSFSDNAIAASGRSAATSPSRRVAYMDISRRTPSSAAATQPLTISTPLSNAQSTQSQCDTAVVSLKDQFGNVEVVNPALDALEQLELVFECYEVQGSLTVYFASDDVNFQHADSRFASEPFSPGSARSTWASPSKRAPVSPYEPLRSPGAHRRAKEQQRRTRVNLSALDSQAGSPFPAGTDNEPEGSQRDLVSLNTLLETITRATARRVFELHRGAKNKKMMASKQHELSKRTSQLAKQDEKLQTLEAMNTMSRQELQNAAAESERLRLLMYAEQRNLKEALKQKKEMNAHLRQSLLELRQESDTRSLVAKRQAQELREKIRALELAREKEQKEVDKLRRKEASAEVSANTLTQQVAEMQRLQKTAEATVRQLRQDLSNAQRELSAAQARDRARTDGEDAKVQGFLQKISRLDEELIAARGTNAFLKKQLDVTTMQLKMAENSLGKEMRTTSVISQTNTSSAASSRPRSSSSGGGGVKSAGQSDATSPIYEDLAESLRTEREHTAALRKQLQDLQMEGKRSDSVDRD